MPNRRSFLAAAFAFTFLYPPKICVISTEAAHSFIVSGAVERPPHFAVAVAFLVVIPERDLLLFSP
jgi:hypothetical protein